MKEVKLLLHQRPINFSDANYPLIPEKANIKTYLARSASFPYQYTT